MNRSEWCLTRRGKRPNRALIWNETYQQGCYILWHTNTKELMKEYRHVNKRSTLKDEDFGLGHAKCLSQNDITCIAFSRARPDVGTIAHECIHWCNHLFENIGIRTSACDDEPQAYFLAWAVNKIYSLTRGKK